MMGLVSLEEEEREELRRGQVSTQPEGGPPQARERALPSAPPGWHSDPLLPASRTTVK